MTKVEILLPGYYLPGESGARVCATVTLIRDNGLNIVVDPGTLPNPALLLGELAKRGLSPGDIGMVFITHGHTDHFRNAGLFPEARLLDSWGLWAGDRWQAGGIGLGGNIEILSTPGHSVDSLTLLVQTGSGRVAVCGDVFWAKDYPPADPFATNKKLLVKSRKKILAVADFIIPGHGDIFSTSHSSL